jgi:SAM-dependent methyltransferase
MISIKIISAFAISFLFTIGAIQQQPSAQIFTETQTLPKKEKDVPYVSSPYEVVEEMLKLANVQSNDVVYDLGCGDGRIVITAAQKYGAHGVGIDIDPVRIKEAWENARKAEVTDKVKFIERDLFEADISEATVVTLYLLRTVNLKLRPKLLAELNPGTRIVSHAFDMGDWKAEKTSTVLGKEIYFWTVPEDRKIPNLPN